MNVRKTFEDETAFAGKMGVIIFACGPSTLADETRSVVNELGRERRVNVELIDESFNW